MSTAKFATSTHRWFLILLIASPILPYLAAPLYNLFLFHAISNRVDAIDTYPNAQLINSSYYFAAGNVFEGSSWNWTLKYHTSDEFHRVIDYYDAALLKKGWSSSTIVRTGTYADCIYPGGVDTKQYTFSNFTLSIPLRPVEGQPGNVYCVYIEARVIALFDLRY